MLSGTPEEMQISVCHRVMENELKSLMLTHYSQDVTLFPKQKLNQYNAINQTQFSTGSDWFLVHFKGFWDKAAE